MKGYFLLAFCLGMLLPGLTGTASEPPPPLALPGTATLAQQAQQAETPPTTVIIEETGDVFGGGGCPYPPGRIWGGVEYLLWWTRGSQLPPLLTTSPPGTPKAAAGVFGPGTSVLFGNQDFANDVRSGGRFYLGGWLNDDHCTGVEGNFFMLQNLVGNYTAGSMGLPILARPFFDVTPGSPIFLTNSSLKIAYPGLVMGSFLGSTKSNLLGSDVYMRRVLRCGPNWRLDMLAGFNYLHLSEAVSITETEIATNPASAAFGIPFVLNDSFSTNNNFYGGEVGLIGDYIRGRFFIHAVGKVALGGTMREVNINGITQVDGGPPATGGFLALPTNIGTHESSGFSVVPMVNFNLGYAILPGVRVFTGYSFLFWSNVARPGEQIDLGVNRTQPPLGAGLVGPPRPDFDLHQSGFWAQGINFGLELRY